MIDLSDVKRISFPGIEKDEEFSDGDTIDIVFHFENEDESDIEIEYPWSPRFSAEMKELFKDFAEIRNARNKMKSGRAREQN